MTIQLRPYQQRVIEDIFAAWDAGLDRVAISVSTGGGKSLIFAEVTKRHLAHRRDAGPVVLLAHRKELIHQAAAHFSRWIPNARVETVIGSPGKLGSPKRYAKTYTWRAADVLATSPQTLATPSTMRDFPAPSLVITDEAHHYASESFRRVLVSLGCFSGGSRLLGVTATPFREDHRGLF